MITNKAHVVHVVLPITVTWHKIDESTPETLFFFYSAKKKKTESMLILLVHLSFFFFFVYLPYEQLFKYSFFFSYGYTLALHFYLQ